MWRMTHRTKRGQKILAFFNFCTFLNVFYKNTGNNVCVEKKNRKNYGWHFSENRSKLADASFLFSINNHAITYKVKRSEMV